MDTIRLKVRGFHCDVYRVVNHARYVEFMEEGTWDYWDRRPELARTLMKNKIDHSVVNMNINYRRSARLGDVLRIETQLARAGHQSITFKQNIWMDNTDELVADAELTAVFFKNDTGEKQPAVSPVFKEWLDLKKLLAKNDKGFYPEHTA